MSSLEVIVLAAGEGKRMYSDLPKVLHSLGGRPLLAHVLGAVAELQPHAVHVVYGHGGAQVPEALADSDVNWVEQAEQRGTGDAVARALPAIAENASVLVVYGDVPLTEAETLSGVVALCAADSMGLLTVTLDDPTGYGRILRDDAGKVIGIVEEKDADEAHKGIREINTGILCVTAKCLRDWLPRLTDNNAQGELYLTDIIALAVADGIDVCTQFTTDVDEVLGVNDRTQLARLERSYQRRQATRLMQAGVTLLDPERVDIRGQVQAGRDVVIDINVVLEGDVVLEDGVQLGPNTWVRDSRLGPRTQVMPNSVIEDADVGADCRIGPFARVRPETQLADGVHVGNFVEIKKSQVGSGSKVNHLSYIADSEIGREVHAGAGTITRNYDGANKHRTIIGD
ncbi:MAG: UDP-N-acetylglucosamine diphosphorylase/glucosamine-1-phosphate N-acetyltransferase, partial [Gammaproteobacteria bacterium]